MPGAKVSGVWRLIVWRKETIWHRRLFFAVKDLDGDGKHYCAVAFESKLARETFCELNGYEPVLVKWAIDNLAGSVYNDIRHYPNIIVDNSLRKPIGFVLEDGSIS